MKPGSEKCLIRLFERYERLRICEGSVRDAFELLTDCYINGKKLLVCGCGGSAADSGHIVGELMKGFNLQRRVPGSDRLKLRALYDDGDFIADNLQPALPALSLSEHSAFITAYMNDICADMIYAQAVYGYGTKGDVLLAISASGSSKVVLNAVKVARASELKTIGLTGETGGSLISLCDTTIRVPSASVPDIQELHLPVYHALCSALEEEFFGYD